MGEHVARVISGNTFTIDTRYDLTEAKILGKGSFGVVTTAFDTVRKMNIAIKRVRPYADNDWDGRHCLREVRLMKLLGCHPNIITLYELSLFLDKNELYMYMELMDSDLHKVIRSKQPLSEKHHKCFMMQILEGIKAMHSIGCFHRDLKPGNILVSKDCNLRITDFGLARFMDEETRQGNNATNPMTEYVVTRWYRPPELLLSPHQVYSEAVDMWSIGCILAELLMRKPLFPGTSEANQVQQIFEVMGYTDASALSFSVNPDVQVFMDKHCRCEPKPLESIITGASESAMCMVKALLTVDPVKRISAEQALRLDWLNDCEVLHDYSRNYMTRPPKEFFDFERDKVSVDDLKALIHEEVRSSSATAYRTQEGKMGHK